MPGNCDGLVALVTGASKGGIGTAIAERFAAEGARVAVAARTTDGLKDALARIEAAGSAGAVFTVDLSDPDGGREDLVARTEAALGPVDILVNNAAMGGYKPFEEWTLRELTRMQQVNVWAPWSLANQVVGGMRERGHGWILNISSKAGEQPEGPPFPTSAPAQKGAAYGSTKAALNRLTVAMAAETHHQGIGVNALSPQAAAATPALVDNPWFPKVFFEPLDTMAEAALALCSGDPETNTGRIAYSLELLLELDRPVYDLSGRSLLEGWQPADIPAVLEAQAAERERSQGPR